MAAALGSVLKLKPVMRLTEDGTRLEPLYSASFAAPGPAQRQDYTQFIFDVSPEELAQYTLRGDFHTASALTEGLWQVTFPLEDKS